MTSIYTREQVSALAEKARQEQETQALTDMNVRSAQSAIQRAESKLLAAQNAKQDVVLDPRWPRWTSAQRAAVQTEAWERCQDAETALKAAQRDYDTALASHAKSLRESQEQDAERAAKDKFDAQQKVIAEREEQAAKVTFHAAYLQSGGTSEQFEKAWPGMWQDELKKRTERAVHIKQNLQASGYNGL